MIGTRRNVFTLNAGCAVFFASVLLIGVSACAQRHRYTAPDRLILKHTRPELIRELEAAEEVDESNARDPRISMIRKEDFFEQADKAERALRELMYGYDVPQSQLAEALSIPPTSLSPQVKADLIRQLQDSITLDDRREQNRLNDYVSEATVDTAPYDAQKAFAADVIKELNIGEDVHWDTLQEALQPLPQQN